MDKLCEQVDAWQWAMMKLIWYPTWWIHTILETMQIYIICMHAREASTPWNVSFDDFRADEHSNDFREGKQFKRSHQTNRCFSNEAQEVQEVVIQKINAKQNVNIQNVCYLFDLCDTLLNSVIPSNLWILMRKKHFWWNVEFVLGIWEKVSWSGSTKKQQCNVCHHAQPT